MAMTDLIPNVKGVAADNHAPAANTAAVVTYAAVANFRHVLGQVTFSLTAGSGTTSSIKVEDVAGTVVVGPLNITANGLYSITFDPPICSALPNTAMIVTLAAGGADVVGVLSCRHWLER